MSAHSPTMRAALTPTLMLYATVVACSSTPPAAEPQAEPIAVTVAVPPPSPAAPVDRPTTPTPDEPSAEATSAPEVDPSEADALAQAKAIYRVGVEAYSKGDYDEASRLFQESYDLSDAPLLLYNIARAELKAGRTPKACDALRILIKRSAGTASGADSAKDLLKKHCKP